jgi:hypothetical protein
MSANRHPVTIDDVFHAAVVVLFASLMSMAALPRDTPPPPDSPAVSLRASVHSARSVPDI